MSLLRGVQRVGHCWMAQLVVSFEEPIAPSPESITVCAYCRSVLVFTDELQLRAMTEDELAALDDETRTLIDVMRTMKGPEHGH